MSAKPHKSEVLGLQWRSISGDIAYAYGKEIDPSGQVLIHAVVFCPKLNEWRGRSKATPKHAAEMRIDVDLSEIDNLQENITQAIEASARNGITLQ
jgi:hypothetical protein